jgi:hypothetical protein
MRRNQAGIVTAMTVALLWGGVGWSGCGGDDGDDETADQVTQADRDDAKGTSGEGAGKDEGAQAGGQTGDSEEGGQEEGDSQPTGYFIDPKTGKRYDVDLNRLKEIRERIGAERFRELKQRAEEAFGQAPGTKAPEE